MIVVSFCDCSGHVKKLEKINNDYSMTHTEKNVQMQELGEKVTYCQNKPSLTFMLQ